MYLKGDENKGRPINYRAYIPYRGLDSGKGITELSQPEVVRSLLDFFLQSGGLLMNVPSTFITLISVLLTSESFIFLMKKECG